MVVTGLTLRRKRERRDGEGPRRSAVVTKKAKSYRAKEDSAMDGVRVGWQPMQFVCRRSVVGSNLLNQCMAVLFLFLFVAYVTVEL